MAVKDPSNWIVQAFVLQNATVRLEPKKRIRDILSRYVNFSFPSNSSRLQIAHVFWRDWQFPEVAPR